MDDTTLNSMARDIVIPEVQTLQKHLASANPHPQYVTISELADVTKTRVCLSDIADVEVQPVNIQDKALVCKNGTWQPVDITTLVPSQTIPVATTTNYGTVKLATDNDMDIAATTVVNTVVTPNVLSNYVGGIVSGVISMATVSVPGIVTLATVADISNATTIENKAVTPYTLKQYIGGAISDATTTTKGVVTLATTADISNATAIENKAVTPYVLKQYLTDNGIGASAEVSYATSQTAGIIRIATSDDMFLPDGSTVITPSLLKEYKETYLIAKDDKATTLTAGIVKVIDMDNKEAVADLITQNMVTPNTLQQYVYHLTQNQFVNVRVDTWGYNNNTGRYEFHNNLPGRYYTTHAGSISKDDTAEGLIRNDTTLAVGYSVYSNGVISGRINSENYRIFINVLEQGTMYDVSEIGTVIVHQEAEAKRVKVLPASLAAGTCGGTWVVYGTVHEAEISCTSNQYATMNVCNHGHLEYATVEGYGKIICGAPSAGSDNVVSNYYPGVVEHIVVHNTGSDTYGLMIHQKAKGYHITLNGSHADAYVFGEAEDVTVYGGGVLHVSGSEAVVKNLTLHSGAVVFADGGAKIIGVTRYPGAYVFANDTVSVTNMDNMIEPDKTIKYLHRMITLMDSDGSAISLIDKHAQYYFSNPTGETVTYTSYSGATRTNVTANVYASIYTSNAPANATPVADLGTLLANFNLYKPLLASTIDYDSALLGVRGWTQSALVRVNEVSDLNATQIASAGNQLSALVFDGTAISDRILVWATHAPAGVMRSPSSEFISSLENANVDIAEEYSLRTDMNKFFSLSLYDATDTGDATQKGYVLMVPEEGDPSLRPLTPQEVELGYITQRNIVSDVIDENGNFGWRVIF